MVRKRVRAAQQAKEISRKMARAVRQASKKDRKISEANKTEIEKTKSGQGEDEADTLKFASLGETLWEIAAEQSPKEWEEEQYRAFLEQRLDSAIETCKLFAARENLVKLESWFMGRLEMMRCCSDGQIGQLDMAWKDKGSIFPNWDHPFFLGVEVGHYLHEPRATDNPSSLFYQQDLWFWKSKRMYKYLGFWHGLEVAKDGDNPLKVIPSALIINSSPPASLCKPSWLGKYLDN